MKTLFNNHFALVRHTAYQKVGNEADSNCLQRITDHGFDVCEQVTDIVIDSRVLRSYDRLLLVSSPSQRAVLTAQLLEAMLGMNIKVERSTADWLKENSYGISDANIQHHLKDNTFVCFIGHLPDIKKYLEVDTLSHCEFYSNNLHISEGKVV